MKNCLAMKTLNFEQMEGIRAGSLRRALSCVGQVGSGMSTLWGAAALLAFGATPAGWIVLGFGAIGLAASLAADPTACDE